MLVRATLKKRLTDDQLMEVRDSISIGRVYIVETASRRMVKGYNTEKGVGWTREMILDFNGEWFPTELLNIEVN